MAVKLTKHQMMILKKMVEIGEATANQMYHIMENHGLDKVDGFEFAIEIKPQYDSIAKKIIVGSFTNLKEDKDAGFCQLVAPENGDKYELLWKNSPEYELLFADEAVRSAMEKMLHREKPLPPDGLWVGASCNSDPVVDWEWDMNDSLS